MWPVLIHSHSYELGTYGVVVALSMLAALAVARHLAPRDGLAPREVNDIGLGVLFAGFLGSKLLGLLVSVFSTGQLGWNELRSAGAIHGGLFAALAAVVVLARAFKVPLLPLLDTYVPAAALGQAIGRLGCFAAGCCFGSRSDVPWAVEFTKREAARLGGVPLHVSLHPVQIYDCLVHLALFGLLVTLHKKGAFRHRLIALWAILEGLIRLAMEGFRGDLGRGTWLGLDWLSTGRLTALLLVVLGVALFQGLPPKAQASVREQSA